MSAGPVLPVPELVDVVPAAEADRILLATRQELAHLEADLAAARAAADAAERRVIEERADPVLLGRAAEELQRFFDQRRASLDAEVESMLAAAHVEAAVRSPGRPVLPGEPIELDAPEIARTAPTPPPAPAFDEPEPDPEPVVAAVEAPAPPSAVDPVPAPASAPIATPTPTPPAPTIAPVTVAPAGAPWVGLAQPVVLDEPASEPRSEDRAPAPAAAGVRLGSVPLVAILQVLGLLVVLVVLLVFVS